MTLFFALFLALVSPDPSKTAMCSCAPSPPPEEALEYSDFVFSGWVTDITRNGDPVYSSLLVDMSTAHWWKGEDVSEVVIETTASSASCGFPFREGEAYLVYGYYQGDQLLTNLCTRTARLEDAVDDVLALGPYDSEERDSPRCGGPTAAVVLQTFVFMFIGMFLLRRKPAE